MSRVFCGFLFRRAVLFQNLHGLFNRQSLDSMAVAARDGRGLEERVVDRFFGRFDDGLEEGRHGVVAEGLRASQVVARANPVRDAEGDDVIAAAVGRRRAGARKSQHRPRRQPFQVPRVHRRVGRHHHNDRTVGRIADLISAASGSERAPLSSLGRRCRSRY